MVVCEQGGGTSPDTESARTSVSSFQPPGLWFIGPHLWGPVTAAGGLS